MEKEPAQFFETLEQRLMLVRTLTEDLAASGRSLCDSDVSALEAHTAAQQDLIRQLIEIERRLQATSPLRGSIDCGNYARVSDALLKQLRDACHLYGALLARASRTSRAVLRTFPAESLTYPPPMRPTFEVQE